MPRSEKDPNTTISREVVETRIPGFSRGDLILNNSLPVKTVKIALQGIDPEHEGPIDAILNTQVSVSSPEEPVEKVIPITV